MKQKVALRRLRRRCIHCDRSFKKGDTYCRKRIVKYDYGELVGYTLISCVKCNYKREQQVIRRKQYIDSGVCKHPVTNEVYSLMSGEDYVQEPSHEECLVCNKRF